MNCDSLSDCSVDPFSYLRVPSADNAGSNSVEDNTARLADLKLSETQRKAEKPEKLTSERVQKGHSYSYFGVEEMPAHLLENSSEKK